MKRIMTFMTKNDDGGGKNEEREDGEVKTEAE